LHKVIAAKNEDLKKVYQENEYMLSFVDEECRVVRNEDVNETPTSENTKSVPMKRLRLK